MTGLGELQSLFGAGASQASSSQVSSPAATGTGATAQADAALTSLAGKDQSVLSSTAGHLSQGLDADDVRADKVAQLKAAIASGTYSVPSTAIADKLIENLLGGK